MLAQLPDATNTCEMHALPAALTSLAVLPGQTATEFRVHHEDGSRWLQWRRVLLWSERNDVTR